MRDHSVDLMVEIARSCKPGGGGTKGDAVRAIRMCFEIMELMKLVSFCFFWIARSARFRVLCFKIIFDRHRTVY